MVIKYFCIKKTITIAIVISIFLWYPAAANAYTLHQVEGITYKVSNNGLYATNESSVLFYSGQGEPAQIDSWTWGNQGTSIVINRTTFFLYRPVAPNGTPIAVPNDCIKTAQIVSAMISIPNINGMQTRDLNTTYRGFPEPYELYNSEGGVSEPLEDPIERGEAYLSVHTEGMQSGTFGDFHVATVIAQDGSDNVTMEASADDPGSEGQSCSRIRSNPFTLSQRNIIFDMYNEGTRQQSFWFQQTPAGSDSNKIFKTSIGKGQSLMCDILDGLKDRQKSMLLNIMGVSQ
ncbi:MAG TPA: hypothetical protein V6D26_06410 [Stenomitos sp.]